jgi:hypothetical protein
MQLAKPSKLSDSRSCTRKIWPIVSLSNYHRLQQLTSPGPDPVPWYYPLEGDLRKAQTWWDCESGA